MGDDQPLFQYTQRGADFHLANNTINTSRIGEGGYLLGPRGCHPVGTFLPPRRILLISTLTCPADAFIPSNPPGAGRLTTAPNPFISSTGVRTPSPEYNGWYVTGTWFFGGHKNYNKEGKWDRPTIDNPLRWNEGRGWGAVELVGKYDVLNMSDKAFNDAGVGCPPTRLYPNLASTGGSIGAPSLGLCGEQRTWIVGVNWYLNDYVRLMFDYAEAELSGYPLTTITAATHLHSHLARYAGFDGGTVRGFGMRAQVDW